VTVPETKRATPLRFRWNHRSAVHRSIVKGVNRCLASVPFKAKYRITAKLRDGRMPYSLVGPGDVIVQVGAPADTLLAGRSRGMQLALRCRGGRAIIVEPDPASAAEFRSRAAELGLNHVTVVNSGAWNEESTLTLLVDPTHPATNFVDGTVDYDDVRRRDFQRVTVPVQTLDRIVYDAIGSYGPVRLLSVTTNNSEREILQGIDGLIADGLQYLCLARTGAGYDEVANKLGFDYLATDDRGFTYLRRH
jgi:FkbM family methyltransferase